MGLFSDIYNTVAKFFRPQEELGDASKSVATNRLKLVLMQDRTNLTPKILEQMRSELIELLSRYVEMDKELLELNFEQEGDQVALMLSIPVIRAKDEDEIEAALNEQEVIENTEEKNIIDEESNQTCDNNESEVSIVCDSDDNVLAEENPVEEDEAVSSQHISTPEEMNSSKVTEEKVDRKKVSKD